MPLSFFWGEEDFLIEKEINQIKENVLGNDVNELNYKAVDNPDFATLVFLLRSQPMLFSDCVYNLKMNRYFINSKKEIKLDDKQIEELINSIQLISDRVHIIFNCPVERGENKKPDSRKKFYKAIQKYGEIKDFPPFKPWEEKKILPVFQTMLKKYNLKATDSVLLEIIKKGGPYLRDLDSILDKLSLYIYPDVQITTKAIENILPQNQTVFTVVDLILQKDFTKAVFEFSNMLQSSHYLPVLSGLQANLSKILLVKIYSGSLSSFEIARKTGQNEYAVQQTLRKIKNVTLEEIIKLKKNLTKAEYEMKTGAKEPITALVESFSA